MAHHCGTSTYVRLRIRGGIFCDGLRIRGSVMLSMLRKIFTSKPRRVCDLTSEQKMWFRAFDDGENGHKDVTHDRDDRVVRRGQ